MELSGGVVSKAHELSAACQSRTIRTVVNPFISVLEQAVTLESESFTDAHLRLVSDEEAHVAIFDFSWSRPYDLPSHFAAENVVFMKNEKRNFCTE